MLTREKFQILYDQGPDGVYALFVSTQTAMQTAIETLTARVKQLEDRRNKDSHNSSKPPSSDNPGRKPRSLRKSTGKKSGGQKGHPGSTLTFSDKPDDIIPHDPQQCSECGACLDEAEKVVTERRQEFDIPPPQIICTEHQTRSCICPHCKTSNKGVFPEGITAPVQYGARIKGALIYAMFQQLLPYNRAQEFISDLFGQAPSEGTINSAIKTCYETLEPIEKEIKTAIINSAVVNFDETGWRVETKLNWLHGASTEAYTYYQSNAKRGCEAMNEIGILPKFTGKAIHDRWKPYNKYEKCSHYFCCAHLLRDLCHIIESTKQTWAQRMSSVLRCALKMKKLAISEKKTSLDKGELNRIKVTYLKIVRRGMHQNPFPEKTGRKGRTKKSDALNLLEFFNGNLSSVLGFVLDFDVPFDNNLAERDIRMVKVKQKISGCFRSQEGSKEFCRIRGYLSTLKKQHLSIMDGLHSVFRGSPLKPCLPT